MPVSLQEQYDKIYQYCYFKVRNATQAEDLTQETFLKYFEQNSYVERGKQLAYLYTIARNLCIDLFRKPAIDQLPEIVLQKDTLERVEQEITLRQALELLPQEQQELLLLRYVNELSMGELATLLGQSRFAVYRKINAALGALGRLLRKEDFV